MVLGKLESEKEPVLLVRAKDGDRTAREDLIAANQTFIARCVARAVPSGPDVTMTDEYSVALLAFNEAVDRYDSARGASFHGFARQLIRRRLVDYYRASRRFARELPHAELPEGYFFDPEPVSPDYEVRDEIERLAVRLAEFGITFEDLVRENPKHRDSRRTAIGIARRILDDPELRASFERKKKLPFTALLRQLVFNPKTIQRHRKYIIAVCLILGGDFPFLRHYVRGVDEGGADDDR